MGCKGSDVRIISPRPINQRLSRILTLFVAFTILIIGVWLPAESGTFSTSPDFRSIRQAAIQFTGVLAMGFMSLAMVLALRLRWIDRLLHGLDKSYRLHKWCGVAALAAAILHWLVIEALDWLIDLETVSESPRQGGGGPPRLPLFRVSHDVREFAETLGEGGLYALIGLSFIALATRISYRFFHATHRAMAVVFVLVACHTLILTRQVYWLQPIGWVMLTLLFGGLIAAAASIRGRIGRHRCAVGKVGRVEYLEGVRVTHVEVQLQGEWPGHQAGQFAYVTFDPREGAHPFTIASAWKGDGRMLFLIKASGDYTGKLPRTLRAGDRVRIEGPYGGFNFEGAPRRQVWIGAGIGITPFVARLQLLAANPDGREIDLIHCTSDVDEKALDRLKASAAAAGVRLHILVDQVDGLLDGARLRHLIPDWASANIWFCGPSGFGDTLRADLLAHGLDSSRFVREFFEMR